jgi:hypothetical protein
MSAGSRPPQIGGAPATIMHNGMEFVSTVEAARRMDISLSTLVTRVQKGLLTPYRIPGIGTFGTRKPHYFKADEIRKFMP